MPYKTLLSIKDKDFSDKTPPLLEDLEAVLRNTEGGKNMAERLDRFTKGSYADFFNLPSNVSMKNKFVVFGIRDMEEELRPMAMFIILRYIWNTVCSSLKKSKISSK